MTQQITMKKTVFNTVGTKTAAAAVAVAAAVLLPQLFHMHGAVSGLGTALGQTFLPMHLPVLLVGLLAGPAAGFAAGALSPLISFALSGMPLLSSLPFMVIELAFYGLTAGFLASRNLPVIFKLLAAQLAGRAVKAIAVFLAVYALNSHAAAVSSIWTGVVSGLPGLILQWSLIPLLMFRITHSEQNHA